MGNQITIIGFAICIFFAFLLYGNFMHDNGITERSTYITIKYENAQQDIYIPLKQAGIELSPEQQKDFENAIKRNHRTVGFR